MKQIAGTSHEDSFIKYKRKHVLKHKDTDYKLSFFTDWEYQYKDVCFMRLYDRMDEWQECGKYQFLYFDDYIDYLDYDSLRLDINRNYGKIIRCQVYTDGEDVLFEFKEKVKMDKILVGCMYLSLFNILRCIGNEYQSAIDVKMIRKTKIRSLRDGILLYSLCVNRSYGHNINDGLSYFVSLLGKEGAKVYSEYYMKVVNFLFGKKSSTSLEKVEKLVIEINDMWFSNNMRRYNNFPGQTALFGILEDAYEKILSSQ